jgi:hypothetical protein
MSPNTTPSHLRALGPGDDPQNDAQGRERDEQGGVLPMPGRTLNTFSAHELMNTTFPPPRWAVPGILCEGVSLLAGPPKVGKSWLSLALGLACAGAGKAFGRIPVRPGPVLYLALEDTPRRLQARMGQLLDGTAAPNALTLATECPPLPAGGDMVIAGWLEAHRDARLVIVDVFQKVRGVPPQGMSAYEADYAAVGRAKRIADDYGVALVLVHHVRKAGADDFLAEVSGTNGIAGAADSTMVLKRGRGQADGVLHITGRDVDETEHALTFKRETGHWLMLDGPASDHALSDTRTAILRFVREQPGAMPKDITAGTGLSHDTVRQTCARMAKDGQLKAEVGGRYSAPPVAGVTPVTHVTESLPGMEDIDG